MRISDYLIITERDIRRQFVRSSLTILALAISAVILVTLTALSIGARHAINNELGPDRSLATIIVTPNVNVGGNLFGGNVQLANDKTATLDDQAATSLKAVPNTVSVLPRAGLYEFHDFTVEKTTKQFIPQANGITSASARDLDLSAGAGFDAGETKHVVVLGYAYAKALGRADTPKTLIGKTVTITTQKGYRGEGADLPARTATRQQVEAFAESTTRLEATIVGLTSPGIHENQLLVPMAWARLIRTPKNWTVSGLTGEDQIAKNGYSSILVQSKDVQDVRNVSAAIDKLGYGVISTQKQIDRINQLTSVMWLVLGAVSLISMITASLGIINTMLITISEQRYNIAVWRACGARKRVIAVRFLLQASLLGLIGGTLGAAIGLIISRLINQRIETLLLAEGLPAINIAAASPKLLVATVILTITFGALSGLYPAFRAARQDTSRALTSL